MKSKTKRAKAIDQVLAEIEREDELVRNDPRAQAVIGRKRSLSLTCQKCGEPFLASSYRGKIPRYCENCYREKVAAKARRYYKANREKVAAKARRYYKANREKVAAYSRRYREANREKVAAYSRRYREANREKVAAYSRRYYKANREKVAAKARR